MAQQIATGREDEPGLNQNGVSGINSPGGLSRPGRRPATRVTKTRWRRIAPESIRAAELPGPRRASGHGATPGIFAPTSFQDAARAQQQALIDQLHGIASGKTYTPADIALLNSYNTAKAGAGSVTGNFRDVGAAPQLGWRATSPRSSAISSRSTRAYLGAGAEPGERASRSSTTSNAGRTCNRPVRTRTRSSATQGSTTSQHGEHALQMGIDVRNTNQANSYARAPWGSTSKARPLTRTRCSRRQQRRDALGYLKDTGGLNQAQIDPNALSSGQYNYKKGGS